MSDSTLHPNTARLQSYVEGALPLGDRAVLESHLHECSACQREADEWRALFGVLAQMPQFSPSVQFADRVMASVRLPDPWYIRVLAAVGDRLQVFAPKTTRGWALATAFMALPITVFGALGAWLLSRPYITPAGVASFFMSRAEQMGNSVAQTAITQALQTDIVVLGLRAINRIATAGLGTATALLAAVAIGTAASAYILYQNLFRAEAHRNQRHATYSF